MVKPKGKSTMKSSKPLTKRTFQQMLDARREKHYNAYQSEGNMPINGGLLKVTQPIIQGDSSNNREGSQIVLDKIYLRYEIALNASSLVDFVRVIMFVDNQNNGAFPAVTDVLVAADPNSSYTAYVHVTKRFKILYDKSHALSIAGNSRAIQVEKTINVKNHAVWYNGTTDAEAANGKGAIFTLYISDVDTTFSAINYDVGVTYYDS